MATSVIYNWKRNRRREKARVLPRRFTWASRSVCLTEQVGIAKQALKSVIFLPRRFSFPQKLGTLYGVQPRRALFTSTYGLWPALRTCRPSYNVSRRIFGNSSTLGNCSLFPSLSKTSFFKPREYPRFRKQHLNIVIRIQEVTVMRDMRSLVDALLYVLGGIVGIGILVTTLLP